MVESLSVRERELLDAISEAQSAENAAAARKASAIREFALLRAASLTSVGEVEPERVERKIVAEVAVACRVSPFQGRRRLHAALNIALSIAWPAAFAAITEAMLLRSAYLLVLSIFIVGGASVAAALGWAMLRNPS